MHNGQLNNSFLEVILYIYWHRMLMNHCQPHTASDSDLSSALVWFVNI